MGFNNNNVVVIVDRIVARLYTKKLSGGEGGWAEHETISWPPGLPLFLANKANKRNVGVLGVY